MHEALALVLGLYQLAALLVLGGVRLGILHHLLDIGLAQTAGSLDLDLLLLVGGLVLRRHGDDAVGVDVEGHLDLRHAARGRRNAHQVELAEQLVVGRHLALALEDPDRHRVLVVLGGGEDLALLGRDRGVAIDQAREHAAQRLDAERERGHVEQQHVLDVALEDAGLDRGADGDDLVRVHSLVRLLAEELLHDLLHLRHAGHAADEDDLVDLARRQAGILERLLAGLDGALDQVVDQALELGARELDGEVLRARGIRRDIGQVDLGLGRARQFDLGLLGRFLQALKSELVLLQVDALLALELVREIFDQAHVEILAAEEGVAVGRLHLEDAVADLEDRDVEGAAAEVIDRDGAGRLLLETIGQRSRRRLVDDAQHLEAGDLAGVLGGLALGVVEIGGNRDDGLGDGLAEIGLRRLLHLGQREGRDLRRRIVLAVGGHPGVAVRGLRDLVGDQLQVLLRHRVLEGPADEALDREEGALRVGDGLPLRRLADQTLAVIRDGDDGRRGARAFRILDDLGRRAFHHCNAAVGRAEVDTNDFTHGWDPFRLSRSPTCDACASPAGPWTGSPPLQRRTKPAFHV